MLKCRRQSSTSLTEISRKVPAASVTLGRNFTGGGGVSLAAEAGDKVGECLLEAVEDVLGKQEKQVMDDVTEGYTFLANLLIEKEKKIREERATQKGTHYYAVTPSYSIQYSPLNPSPALSGSLFNPNNVKSHLGYSKLKCPQFIRISFSFRQIEIVITHPDKVGSTVYSI